MADAQDTSKPDFRNGFALRDLPDGGTVSGRVDSEDAILVRQGDRLFAVGAHCTHYHGPLADGLVVGETVRCPWHHACFSLSTGEALRAPALDAISCWRVERVGDMAYVREKLGESAARTSPPPSSSRQPAGLHRHRRRRRRRAGGGRDAPPFGYDGSLTMLSADDSQRRVIGRTCRRTSWRAPRRTTGFRCARPSSTPRTASTWC